MPLERLGIRAFGRQEAARAQDTLDARARIRLHAGDLDVREWGETDGMPALRRGAR